MRLGIFTDAYLPYVSGVVTAVESLKKALELHGIEVFIITINGKEDGKRGYVKDDHIIRIPGIKTPKGLYDYYFRLVYPYKAVKMVKDLNLDIIHTQTEAMIGMFGKSMAKKLNIPVVHTMHTMYEDCCDYITKGHFEKIGKRGARDLVVWFLSKTVKEVIVPGNKPYVLLKDKYRVKQNVTEIPNGIELDHLNSKYYDNDKLLLLRKKYKIAKDDFIVLWVGRLGFEKNIKFLIEAHKKMVTNLPKLKLVIVGTGPEEKNLKELAGEYINKSIIFTGKIKNSERGEYYHLTNVFASASTFETQGLTLIEAMACSLPVVCINDKSFLDIVTNKYDGFIFKDMKEYIKYIDYSYNNLDVLKEMKTNALKSSSKYSLSIFGKEVLKVYNRALKNYECDKKKQSTN